MLLAAGCCMAASGLVLEAALRPACLLWYGILEFNVSLDTV